MKKNPNIKILVACHKDDPNIRQDDIYMPIHVGKALNPDLELGYQCDSIGENISEKNGAYCELTALYWAWKNLKDVDYIGLCHYRRYFAIKIDHDNLKRIMINHDIVALKHRNNPFNTLTDLSSLLTLEDCAIMIDTLLLMYPNYEKSAVSYLLQNNTVSQCNMFIMSWEEFDKYCNFIFPLLFKIEKRIKYHNYTRLKRNIGYMAECLQGLYVLHNKLRPYYVDKFEAGFSENSNKLKKIIRNMRNNLIFSMINKDSQFNIYNSVRVGLKQDGIELKKV